MGLSNEQLIHEAIECNHAGVGATTLERYRDHLVHVARYLASVQASDFYGANKNQVRRTEPRWRRFRCEWCKPTGASLAH